MSAVTGDVATRRPDPLHPLVAAALGATVYAATMTAGVVFDLNADTDGASLDLGEIPVYLGLVLSSVALAVWLGMRARAGTPRRLVGTALGLALGAAATFVVFWSGWPIVLGATAVSLGLEHRRRVGSLSGTALAAIALGAASALAAAVTCVIG